MPYNVYSLCNAIAKQASEDNAGVVDTRASDDCSKMEIANM